MAEQGRKRKRPSAKETQARMSQAFSMSAPMSRAEEEPSEAGGEGAAGRGRTDEQAPERRGESRAGEKLVRLSVDVPRSQHRFLRVLAAESGVTGMAVVRALLEEAEGDETLVERLRERMAGETD